MADCFRTEERGFWLTAFNHKVYRIKMLSKIMKNNCALWNYFEPYMKRSKESLERSKISAREYEKGKVKTIKKLF